MPVMEMQEQEHKQALPSGHIVGSYRLHKVLGVGGFGVTYMGEHMGLAHMVAIKEYLPSEFAVRDGETVHPKSDAGRVDFAWGLERFIEEGRTLTKFRHPNIVKVLDLFKANNTAYIVMEYEDGLPLDVLLARRGTLTEGQLRNVVLPVADGLRQVHAAGFLHRDIKPANIYVRRADESPVLLDFGAARQSLGAKSRSMTVIASAGYSPPEQYAGQGAQGPWTDIYALSALCYRAITGKPPMDAPSRQREMLRSQNDPLPSLAQTGATGYSMSLLKAVDQGLRIIEAERPQRIDDWIKALDKGTEASKAPEAQCKDAKSQTSAKNSADSEDTLIGFLKKLFRGRYGLAKTYWLFDWCAFLIAALAWAAWFYLDDEMRSAREGGSAVFATWKFLAQSFLSVVVFSYVPYCVIVMIGIWRAAGAYGGRKIWAVLARVQVLVQSAGTVFSYTTDRALLFYTFYAGSMGAVPLLLIISVALFKHRSRKKHGGMRKTPHLGDSDIAAQKTAKRSTDNGAPIAGLLFLGGLLLVMALSAYFYETNKTAYGTLTVAVEPPDATITLAGSEQYTYISGVSLPIGTHTLLVERLGYKPQYVKVSIRDGENSSYAITLIRYIDSFRSANPHLADLSDGELLDRAWEHVRKRSPISKEEFAQGFGVRKETAPNETEPDAPPTWPFTVRTYPPNAHVEIVGHDEDYAAGMLLQRGGYQVRVSAPRYETKQVTVQHDSGPTDIAVSLDKIRQPFTVRTRPAGSKIEIEGSETPYYAGMLLPWGEYKIKVSASGHRAEAKMVWHSSSTPTNLLVDLDGLTLQAKAELGDAEAQFALGVKYGKGADVDRDYEKAAKWFLMAASQGHAQSQYHLAAIYDYGQGVTQDHIVAAQWYRKAAEQGHADAQNNLGASYAKGQGVMQDHRVAVQWYRKAAEQGHGLAQINLGHSYDNGLGVAQDKQKAVQWYRKAAEQGIASAQYNLGVSYANGQGVAQDQQVAVQWYRKAAEQGDADAQYNLGYSFAQGQGVAQNMQNALYWYRKSAAQGNGWAQNNLGASYMNGTGVPVDYVRAYAWFLLASAKGVRLAENNQMKLLPMMTSEQVASAKELRWRLAN